MLLDSSLCRESREEVLRGVIKEASIYAPGMILSIIETFASNQKETQELLKVGLTGAARAPTSLGSSDNSWRSGSDTNSFLGLYETYFPTGSMWKGSDQVYAASLIKQILQKGQIDTALSMLLKVDSSHGILRHEPDILIDLASNCFTSDHNLHPRLRQITELLLVHGAPTHTTCEASQYSGLAPLGISCINGESDAFFALVEAGAKVSEPVMTPPEVRTAENEFTLLQTETAPANLISLALLGLCEGDLSTDWEWPLSQRFGDIIYFLLRQGMVPNIRSAGFEMLCQIAACQGNRKYVDLLCDIIKRQMTGKLDQEMQKVLNSVVFTHGAAIGGQVQMEEHLLDLDHNPRESISIRNSGAISVTAAIAATLPIEGRYSKHREASASKGRELVKGKLQVLTLLLKHGIAYQDRPMVFEFAASHGGLNILLRLWEEGFPPVEDHRLELILEKIFSKRQDDSIRMLIAKILFLPNGSRNILANFCTKYTRNDMFGMVGWEKSYINRCYIEKNRGTIGPRYYNERTNLLSQLLKEPDKEPQDIQAALNLGANPNLSELSMTPVSCLSRASKLREPEASIAILSLLVTKGCDVNKSKPGFIDDVAVYDTPLHTAIRVGAERTFLNALIHHGADINSDGGFGTPLFHARTFRNDNAAQLLIERGARDATGVYSLAELAVLRFHVSEGRFNDSDYEDLDEECFRVAEQIKSHKRSMWRDERQRIRNTATHSSAKSLHRRSIPERHRGEKDTQVERDDSADDEELKSHGTSSEGDDYEPRTKRSGSASETRSDWPSEGESNEDYLDIDEAQSETDNNEMDENGLLDQGDFREPQHLPRSYRRIATGEVDPDDLPYDWRGTDINMMKWYGDDW